MLGHIKFSVGWDVAPNALHLLVHVTEWVMVIMMVVVMMLVMLVVMLMVILVFLNTTINNNCNDTNTDSSNSERRTPAQRSGRVGTQTHMSSRTTRPLNAHSCDGSHASSASSTSPALRSRGKLFAGRALAMRRGACAVCGGEEGNARV